MKKRFTGRQPTKPTGCNPPIYRRPCPPPAPCLRTCSVDGKPCVFHRWVDDDRALLDFKVMRRAEDMERAHRLFLRDGIVCPGDTVELIRKTFALVEYSDGSVRKVDPELVHFTDKEEVKE